MRWLFNRVFNRFDMMALLVIQLTLADHPILWLLAFVASGVFSVWMERKEGIIQ